MDATLVPLTFPTRPCLGPWLTLFWTHFTYILLFLLSKQKQSSMWRDIGTYGEKCVSPSLAFTRGFQVCFLIRQIITSVPPWSSQAIQVNFDSLEWPLIPSPKQLYQPQMHTLGMHGIGNCDIQKRWDLEAALGPNTSSAIYWVIWVRSPPSICTWISHQ